LEDNKNVLSLQHQTNKQKHTIMENVMKSAIEAYSKLTNRTFQEVATEMQTNKVVQESIAMLMFSVSK